MALKKNIVELGNRLLKYFAPECKKKITGLYTDKFHEYLVRRIADKWNLDFQTEMPGKFTFHREFILKGKGVGKVFKDRVGQ